MTQPTDDPGYSPGNILDKQPVTISTVIIAGINVGVAFGLDVTVEQLAAINVFVTGGLALFVNKKTANKAVLQGMAQN